MNQFKQIQQCLLIHAGIVFLVLVMLVVSSCQKSSIGDCFTSTGSIQKEERTVSYFKSIQLEDNVNLFLNQAGQNKLVVEAGGNLLSEIVTEVTSDSVLVISNNNRCNWVRSYDKPINVYLDFTRLDNLDYRSIGDVINQDTIRLDSMKINVWEGAGKIELLLKTETCQANLHDGTADIVLRGISKINYYYQLGAGKVDARSAVYTGKGYSRDQCSS